VRFRVPFVILKCNSFKTVLAQIARNDSVNHLIETMADIYSFVHEAEPLKKFASQKQILVDGVWIFHTPHFLVCIVTDSNIS
jgi:hypothetical protein